MKMPTPYELASIAATLARNGATTPQETTEQAFKLWVSACAEIDGQVEALEKRKIEGSRCPDAKMIPMMDGVDENGDIISPVMEWVNENATHSRDHFKKFPEFKKAWMKFNPDPRPFPFSHDIAELKRFLQFREEERRRADAERKRVSRETAKVQKPVKKK